MALYLASTSPRRRELLGRITTDFIAVSRNVEEREYPDLLPREKAVRRCKDKCISAVNNIKDDNKIIIASDTVVDLNGVDMGKPRDEKEAFEMIKALSGKAHWVYTAVSVYKDKHMYTFCDGTQVYFDIIEDQIIAEYVKTSEPYDKAGGYAIQGFMSKYIDRIEGDYNTVVGFPIARVNRLLKSLKII